MKWTSLNRAKIKVYGKKGKVLPKGFLEEHISFLQSTLTNDIASLKDGEFNYNLWLTGNGQPIEDFFVFRDGDSFILDTEATPEKVITQFTKIKLSLQVFFEDLTEKMKHVFLFGDGSKDFIEKMFEKVPEKFSFLKKENMYVARNPLRIGEDGFDIFGNIDELIKELKDYSEINQEEFEDLRIENCIPRIHKELREGFHPLEANIEKFAFSFTKGCYVGQEAIARVHFRGRTPRTLSKFEIEGDVRENDEIFSDDKKIGVITSVNSKKTKALGYILRAKAEQEKEFKTKNGIVRFINECHLSL